MSYNITVVAFVKRGGRVDGNLEILGADLRASFMSIVFVSKRSLNDCIPVQNNGNIHRAL